MQSVNHNITNHAAAPTCASRTVAAISASPCLHASGLTRVLISMNLPGVERKTLS